MMYRASKAASNPRKVLLGLTNFDTFANGVMLKTNMPKTLMVVVLIQTALVALL